jgi:mRNA interferase RelE/StbE
MLILQAHPKVFDSIDTLPAKHYKQVVSALFSLLKQPHANDVAYLQGYDNLKRKDVGEYRIVFEHDSTTLYVWAIGKRNDSTVYKILRRKI